jgi:putative nucleotidyltransferase with HDIG domain
LTQKPAEPREKTPAREEEMLRLIAFVSGALLDAAPFPQRLGGILTCIASAFNSKACVIRELQGYKLKLLAASGADMKTLPADLPATFGIAGRLLDTQRGLIINDVPHDPLTAPIHKSAMAGHFRFGHYAGAPMMTESKPIGAVGIYRDPGEPEYEPQDLLYLEIVANQLAVSLQNNRLYREQISQRELLEREVRQRRRIEKKVQKQLQQSERLVKSNQKLVEELQQALTRLSDAYDVTLEAWCAALDLRDEGTMGHSVRVTETALQLARRVRYPEEELATFRRGSLLHDIGKMAIPDSILLKPGPLTNDEWAIMRRHPELASEFLHKTEFLRDCAEIPLCHHERWDGSGYPHGLSGESIPLSARIFSVVDVWDALSSDRPYRKAWKQEQVIEYLRENRGAQFDARIVDSFLEMLLAP